MRAINEKHSVHKTHASCVPTRTACSSRDIVNIMFLSNLDEK